jgi:activator of HSP90 ATPase
MKELKKYYNLEASPSDVYNAMTNPSMLEIWTGETVEMSTEPGSEFSLWDGAIAGKNLEFEKDRKIVQLWYFGEDEQSTVTINLYPDKKGTRVELHQNGIPDEAYENMIEGWDSDYFGNLKELFEK